MLKPWTLVGWLLFLVPLAAVATDIQREVGGTVVASPVPDGFIDSSRAQVMAVMEHFVPKANRQLAVFLLAEDDAQWRRTGRAPDLKRYAMLQTIRQLEARGVSSADFAKARAQMRELSTARQREIVGSTNKEQRETLRPRGVDATVDDVRMQGVFLDTDDAQSRVVVSQMTVNGRTYEVASTSTLLLAKGKLLLLHSYVTEPTADDFERLRREASAWVDRARALNRAPR